MPKKIAYAISTVKGFSKMENCSMPPVIGTKGFVYFEHQHSHPAAGAFPIQASARFHRVITSAL